MVQEESESLKRVHKRESEDVESTDCGDLGDQS